MGPKKSRTREQQSSEQDEASDPSSIQQTTQESSSHSSGAMGSQGLGTTAETAVHGTNPNRVGDPTPSYEFGHPGLAPSPSEHNIQRALEERMDADFSNVRIHTGAKAAKACDRLGSQK